MATPFGDGSFIIGTVARIYFIPASVAIELADTTFGDQVSGSDSISTRWGSPVFGGSQLAHSYLYLGGGGIPPIPTHGPPPNGYKMIRKCPNCWDYAARREHRLAERGTICRPHTPWWVGYANVADPQHVFPKEAREIYRAGAVDLDFTAVNASIFEFRVPVGYEGLLYALFNRFDGAGLVPGSGDILWHVKVGPRYPRGLGNIAYELGEHASSFPMADYVNLISNQTVEYRYTASTTAATSLSTGKVIAALWGWIWPMGTDFGPDPALDKLLPDPYRRATGNQANYWRKQDTTGKDY